MKSRDCLMLGLLCTAVASGCERNPTKSAETAPSAGRVHLATSRVVLEDPLPWYSQSTFAIEAVNETDAVCTISTVHSSCVCTVFTGDVEGRAIQPGGSIRLEGAIDTGSKQGRFERRIDIVMSDGTLLNAVIEYEVYATYNVSPFAIDYGRGDWSAAVSDTARTARFASDFCEIESVSCDSPWLGAAFEKGESETLIVTSLRSEHLAHGKNVGRVYLSIGDPHQPEFVILVSVTNEPNLRAVPSRLFVRDGDQARVKLLDQNGNDVSVARADSADENVVVSVDEGQAIIQWKLVAHGHSRSARATIHAIDGRTLTVPIYRLTE